MTSQVDLYQQVILEHNKKPRNFGKLVSHTHAAEGFNPLCGDHLWVYLQIAKSPEGADVIQEAAFEGSGCAICKASASMMTMALKGQSPSTAKTLFSEFQSLLKGELNPDTEAHSLGKLKIFSGIWQYPARVKCAALAWHALNGALSNQQTVSTE
jgi:nitrogen fixation NifU-like protein